MRKRPKDTHLYLRLLRYVRPYWRLFVISVLAMIIVAATDPALASLLKPMLDGAFVEKDPETIRVIPLFLIGIFLLRGVATFIGGASLHWVANKVIMDVRNDMFNRLLILPSRYYDQHNSGALISRFTYDVTQIRDASTTAITISIRDSLSVIGLLGWMLYINWKLTLLCLICAPVITFIVSVIRKRLRKMGRKVQASMGDINHILNESIQNHKLVKLYSGQTHESQRFYDANNNNRKFMMKFAIAAVASSPSVQLITAVVLALVVYIATLQASAGAITVGEFGSFIAAMVMIMTPVKRLVALNEHLQKGLAACESIFELLDQPPEQDAGSSRAQRIEGDIEFRGLSFRYNPDDRKALSNVSLHIRPGESVALVGQSGSGKTTIANLIPAFYPVTEGEIRLDGVDIRDYTLASLRANIALVSQDVALFNDTLRNNIAYGGMKDATDEQVRHAAEVAHAWEFIEKMPEGLNTIIGEKGQRLSGGQRQRLAIARAILKDAPVLILDEATSSLDTESERHIQEALDTIRQGRTCIIIAHRLSTIENADRILVIDQGQVVEAGTHDELISNEGVYARLHRTNFASTVH